MTWWLTIGPHSFSVGIGGMREIRVSPNCMERLRFGFKELGFPEFLLPDYRLVYFSDLREGSFMGEIVKFVHNGAARITPNVLKRIHKKLPLLKLEFTDIDSPGYPHLPEQLKYLTDVVEDFVEGVADDLPYVTVASAAFAVIYAHRQFDLIPDWIPDFGHADDSAIVRAVLMENEKVLADYAEKLGLKWSDISVKP